MSLHKDITGDDVHRPYTWTYANAAARTGASGFVTADVGKLAIQSDNDTLWILTAITPTWQAVSALGTAPGSDTQVIFNDGGVLNAVTDMAFAKATGNLTITGEMTCDELTSGIGVSAVTSVTAGTYVSATTYVKSTTYNQAGTDYRLVSTTANSGGGLKRLYSEATSGALSGATGTIEVNIPIGARVLGAQLRVDTAVTGPAGGTSASYTAGLAAALIGTMANAKNTKLNTMVDANGASDIASAEVDITLTALGDPYTAGVIRAIVYYEDFIAMDNNP